jgi:hypothetical protein
VCHDIWEGSDYLLLWREVGALLEFEIANGTRQREIAVNSAKVDETTGSTNASLFAYQKSVFDHGKPTPGMHAPSF